MFKECKAALNIWILGNETDVEKWRKRMQLTGCCHSFSLTPSLPRDLTDVPKAERLQEGPREVWIWILEVIWLIMKIEHLYMFLCGDCMFVYAYRGQKPTASVILRCTTPNLVRCASSWAETKIVSPDLFSDLRVLLVYLSLAGITSTYTITSSF